MEQANASDGAIQVNASQESPVLHSVEVEVEAEKVDQAYARAYRDLAKQVRVKGFRPGRVPRSVLERLYSASIADQIEQTLVGETLRDAVELAGLEPVSEPSIDAQPPTSGEVFRYTLRVEVKPEIELFETSGLNAEKPAVSVSEEDVTRELETLRQHHAPEVEEPADSLAREGTILWVDFVGRIDGEAFEGGSAQDARVEIGSGQFIPGFEEQLVGAIQGEDREVRVSFPEDYGNAELAGKEAVFQVHVDNLKRREPVPLDDEFAKDMGDFENLEALTERIRTDLVDSRERASKSHLHRTLMDSLIERVPMTIPPSLVEQELGQQLQAAQQRLQGSVSPDDANRQLSRWADEWRPRAERQVREALLLESVAGQQQIEVTEEEVRARLEELAGVQGVEAAALEKAYRDEASKRAIRRQLCDEKALEFLVAQANVVDTTDT
ncbi:trigger factor [Myxococcota bacterium]|nr:trigger factor [Myxococcota bacterium]